MSEFPKLRPRGHLCPECCGVRLFRDLVRKCEDGRRVRCRECSVCGHRADYSPGEQPGVACPKCCDVRLRILYVRHRKGATVRVRKCYHCEHRIRTCERVESYAA